MTKRAVALCFILMACSACASKPAPLDVSFHADRCPRPAARGIEGLGLALLDPGQHIGSAENVQTVLEDLEAVRAHVAALNGALDCYETQAAKGGE